MKKLYTLKNWYSLTDAAKRIAAKLGEDFSINDLLHMAVEGHLPLSWYMRLVPAQEVIPFTQIYSWNTGLFSLPKTYETSPDSTAGVLSVYPFAEDGQRYQVGNLTVMSCIKLSENVGYLDGFYNLDLAAYRGLKEWVLALMNGTQDKLFEIERYFIRDSKGGLWRIMRRLTKDELEAQKKDALPSPVGHQKPFNHYSNFCPSGLFPDQADLGITKADLEAFEALLDTKGQSKKAKTEKPLLAKERESLLKLAIGMAKKGYGYDPKKVRSDAIPDILSDLEKCGIPLDDATIRKYLREGAELLPPVVEEA